MRTLIVDDSPVMCMFVERALRQAGIEISDALHANNGNEALEVLRDAVEPFDLIISDINMPGMDGLEFLEQRRSQNLAPGVPIFIMTTESSPELVLRVMAAGARDYICKPLTGEQIRTRIVPLLAASTSFK